MGEANEASFLHLVKQMKQLKQMKHEAREGGLRITFTGYPIIVLFFVFCVKGGVLFMGIWAKK